MQRYAGHPATPTTVSLRKRLLVEFDRDGRPSPSLPFLDPFKPRRATWFVGRHVLPVIYWRRLLRGKV